MAVATHVGGRPIAVSARGLHKRYRLGEHQSLRLTARRLLGRGRGLPEFEALAGVDFTCHRGEALGIVGVNGSGKSTLLQVIAGTTLPTSGAVTVTGSVVPLLAVGQGFHPELTGEENVTLFASSLRIPRRTIESGMDAVAAFAELESHMDTPVKRFSSGMIARLSFGVAMQFPADIYVLDEVLAVVDVEFQARCLEEIARLRRSGSTVIFVSHHRGQVAEVCDRVMWLEDGNVRDFGPTADVLDAYEAVHHPPGS
jgi:ABC-type polysaccharide/polyol phosphate transport system ATPase subunit